MVWRGSGEAEGLGGKGGYEEMKGEGSREEGGGGEEGTQLNFPHTQQLGAHWAGPAHAHVEKVDAQQDWHRNTGWPGGLAEGTIHLVRGEAMAQRWLDALRDAVSLVSADAAHEHLAWQLKGRLHLGRQLHITAPSVTSAL